MYTVLGFGAGFTAEGLPVTIDPVVTSASASGIPFTHKIDFVIDTAPTNNVHRLRTRHIDSSNNLFLTLIGTSNLIQVKEVIGGSSVLLFNTAASVWVVTDTITWIMNGTAISVQVNSVEKGSATASAGLEAGETVTWENLGASGAYSGCVIDNV